ncbi:MAG: RnfABCDGE type electron transport complex subunit A [Ruminococcaceae bacterium]|nr:RnfABCDGE type electron transport complex subunit A [Oscillospiraceae bacterium]
MLADIFVLMLSAVLIENFIFSRFMGCCPFLGVSEKPDTALGMGCAVIFVMTLASAACNVVYNFILVPFGLEYLYTIAFILVIAALVQFIEMFLRKAVPSLYNALGIYLPLITTNCAVLGAVILNMQKYSDMARGDSFIFSVLFGFFAAVGFTLAIVIFAGVRARMEYGDPPKAFKGMPIALVAAGLIAMAFSGFSGTTIG